MNRVAGRANYIGLRVIAAPDIAAARIFFVTSKACIQNLARRQCRKGHDGILAAFSVDMLLPGTVTPLTPCILRRRFGRHARLVVGISEKLQRYVRMACPAHIAACKLARCNTRGLNCRLRRRAETAEKQ